MIIQRYLLREIGSTFIGVAFILLLIFLSGIFVRILADTVEGDYPVSVMFALFGLKGIGNLMFVLPLGLFIGILLALGRLYKDSEMSAMFACGVRPRQVLGTVAVLATLVALLSGFLSLYLTPWAEELSVRLVDEASAESELEGIVAGRFNQSDAGGHLLYTEALSDDRRNLYNVFAHARVKGERQVLTADSAHQVIQGESGDRFLVFVDGYRYEGRPGEPDFKVIRFERHGLRLQEREVTPSKRPRYAIPSMTLWRSRDISDITELHWRLAVPISTFIMALMAVPLGKTNPRQGRFAKLFTGIVLYIVYNNLLSLGRAWVTGGAIDISLGLWWVHGLMLVVALVLIARQDSLSPPWYRRLGWSQ